MKARTKSQLRVTSLHKYLPRITEDMENWAKVHCLDHIGCATKNRVLCLDCGNKFPAELVSRAKAVCPHCGTKISIKKSKKRSGNQRSYFAITEIVEEYQVVRHYVINGVYRDSKPAHYNCYEIFQQWILPNGDLEIIGFTHNTMGWSDSWGGYFEVRNKRSHYRYNTIPYKFHPASKIKKEYRKFGLSAALTGISFINALKAVLDNPQAETLLKAKQYELFSCWPDYSYKLRQRWPSIKICLRNKYKPSDAGIFFDYLDLLEHFAKDLRNAKYVCPKNLESEHDRLVRKKQDLDRKQALEPKRRRMDQAQAEYAKRIAPYVGLQFSSGNITVKVLETVQEFYAEGSALRHCVFTNDYYNKKDSLVLSARIDDQPIETIEVSLRTLKILQSRGLQNQPSERNKEIVALVRRNLSKIKAIHQQKTA